MGYTIEQRNGVYHIITDQKYKGDTITINLESIVKTEQAKSLEVLDTSIELLWILRYDENLQKIYMDLLVDLDNGLLLSSELNIEQLIAECVSCITNNKLIEDCDYLMSCINYLYKRAFIIAIKEHAIAMCSNMIIEGHCSAKKHNKLLGEAPRFSLNMDDSYSIFEYVGQPLNDESPRITIKCEDIVIDIVTIANTKNFFYDPDIHEVAYYTFNGISNSFSSNKEEEVKEYPKLKVPMKTNTHEAMYQYLIKHNSMNEIIAYKKAMKPKLKLININSFMVKEFNT